MLAGLTVKSVAQNEIAFAKTRGSLGVNEVSRKKLCGVKIYVKKFLTELIKITEGYFRQKIQSLAYNVSIILSKNIGVAKGHAI
jgi:hypothetical protein